MVRTEAGNAYSHDAAGRILIALCAHGYGDVAEHPEQIFTDIVMAGEFIRKSGGSLKQCAASSDVARIEIVLPKVAAAARWLADD